MVKKPASRSSRPRPAIPAGSQPFIAEPEASSAAAHGATLSPDMDYAAHEATYMRFTRLVKWGIGCIAVLLIFLFIVVNPIIPPPAS
jgi:Bacterial aa3 type cytochrome c oxidase subunit IV